MSELEDRIQSVLNDPDQMQQILGMARSLMGGGPEPEPPKEPGGFSLPELMGGGGEAGLMKKLASLLGGGGAGREQALLEAMKPWLSESRSRRMDRALKLGHMARAASLALGEWGGGDDA